MVGGCGMEVSRIRESCKVVLFWKTIEGYLPIGRLLIIFRSIRSVISECNFMVTNLFVAFLKKRFKGCYGSDIGSEYREPFILLTANPLFLLIVIRGRYKEIVEAETYGNAQNRKHGVLCIHSDNRKRSEVPM